MQGIEFEEDKSFSASSTGAEQVYERKTGFITGLLLKIGIVDKTTANLILLGLAVIFFGIAIFIFAGIIAGPTKDWSLDQRAGLEAQKYQH